MCYRRQAVLIKNGKKHLHFVVTDPMNRKVLDPENGEVLLIGITRDYIEPDFVLKRGNHPFIEDPSYINYGKAFIIRADAARRCLEEGIWERERDASEKIIQKVCEGILESDHTTPKIERFFKSYEILKKQLKKTG